MWQQCCDLEHALNLNCRAVLLDHRSERVEESRVFTDARKVRELAAGRADAR